MERIENGEDVVGGKPQDTVCKERKAPRDAQSGAQSKDTADARAAAANSDVLFSRRFGQVEPGQEDNEGGEGEEEDHGVVGDVDDVLDLLICHPAPFGQSRLVLTRTVNHVHVSLFVFVILFLMFENMFVEISPTHFSSLQNGCN